MFIACVSYSRWMRYGVSVSLCFGANGYTHKRNTFRLCACGLIWECCWQHYPGWFEQHAQRTAPASADTPRGNVDKNTHMHTVRLLLWLSFKFIMQHSVMFIISLFFGTLLTSGWTSWQEVIISKHVAVLEPKEKKSLSSALWHGSRVCVSFAHIYANCAHVCRCLDKTLLHF